MQIRTMHDLCSVVVGRRIELGLTQAEVASRAGVSRDWVNYFERGKRTVELSLVFRVLEVLGIGIEALDATAADAADAPDELDLDNVINQYIGRAGE